MLCAAFAAALSLAACAPPAHPLVAEVYYDAIGDDTGWEFVELYNPASVPFALAGLRLEAGDGSTAGRWTLRWTGATSDTVRAASRFVIGGARVVPVPDAVVTLELQNGPDALRLVWLDGSSEVVGWGAHEFAEYACSTPAPDVASGQSLARVPDDADRGSNALDFRAAEPSPGRANLARVDAAMVRGALAVAPERPAALAPARLTGALTDAGLEPIAAGAATIEAEARAADGALATATLALGALAPGDTLAWSLELPPLAAGRWTLLARVRLAADEAAANDVDSLALAVGDCALRVSEIQFHPAAGEGEWVEVRNVSSTALDLAAFTLSDRGATRARLSGGEGALAPDSLALLAQDRAALLARFSSLDPRRVWQGAPWPALNNSDDTTGHADAVVLREDGVACARTDYSAAGIPAGVPLEWRDGGWWPGMDAAGTPLQPPRPPAALASRFQLTPRRLRPGAARTRLEWALPWPRAHAAVEVYDLAGRRVARALDDVAVPAHGTLEWDAVALPAGLYVVALRARADSGGETLTETRALRVDGVEP